MNMEKQRNWAVGVGAVSIIGLFADKGRQTVKSWFGMEETVHVTVTETTTETTTTV